MSRVARLARILQVCRRYRLDTFLDTGHLPESWRRLLRLAPFTWGGEPAQSRAVRLRRSLEELGPIFIKFGQMLSTRRDLVPPDIADELAACRMTCRRSPRQSPSPSWSARSANRWNELFASFEAAPLASASVAQVHAATLFDGRARRGQGDPPGHRAHDPPGHRA